MGRVPFVQHGEVRRHKVARGQIIAQKLGETAKIVKLNVDDNPSVTQRFGIKGIPTMIVFKGGKEAERLVGATNEVAITRIIEEQISVVKA